MAQIVYTYFNNKLYKVISYWLLILCIVTAIYFVSSSNAYADGTVPPSATSAYPGLDPRLVGVPIVKTESTAALVAYSEAVNRVNELETLKVDLQAQNDLLKPELSKAQVNAATRKKEYEDVSQAYQSLILTQYQDASEKQNTDDFNKPNNLRQSHQAQTVSKSLRVWKHKAKSRMKDAEKYLSNVEKTIDSNNDKITNADSDLISAKKNAQDRKNIVRSTIPVASIQGLDIPVLTMDAYLRAEKRLAVERPTCGITWWALAGIGRAESNHGRFHGAVLDQNGTVFPAIIGVQLNGNGFAAIGDSDQGKLDGDTQWDRAVGVMQFIPGTWRGYGEDGNGDGAIDPQNVYDAALAAGNLLCANARPDMTTEEGRRTAFFRYNNSKAYVDFVAAKGHEYEAIGAGRFNPAPIAAPDSTTPSQ